MLITESIVNDFSMDDFIWGCHRAYQLLESEVVSNLPRKERVEECGGLDRFRLEMCSMWPGLYKSCKIIDERSDITTGRLSKRIAHIDLYDIKNDVSIKLDAGNVTDMRTGAAGALALNYVKKHSIRTIAIIGTGRIARNLAMACDILFELDHISFTSRKKENRQAFLRAMKSKVKATLKMFPTIEDCLPGVDAVLMAVPTASPIINSSIFDSIPYLVVIGGDSRTRQVSQELMEKYPIVVDDIMQAKNSGEFIWAYDNRFEDLLRFAKNTSGEVLTLDKYVQSSSKMEQALIYLTGMSIHDLCSAAMIYEKIARIEGGPMGYVR